MISKIEPTIGFDAAALQHWEVVVVGAGPAGSMAARLLALDGVQVLLLDKAAFPRWKICGSCLNPWGLDLLRQVDLENLPEHLGGVKLTEMLLAAGQRQVCLKLPGSVSLSREIFDASLIQQAIKAGVAFLPETQASLGRKEPKRRMLILRHDDRVHEVAANLVLAADGLGGRLAVEEPSCRSIIENESRIGAGAIAQDAPSFYRRGVIHMACGLGSYIGLVRLEDDRLNIGAAFDLTAVKDRGGLGKMAAEILRRTGWPAIAGLADLAWRGTPPLTRHVQQPAANRLLILGDAACYAEPFTGEGMSWAMAQAVAIAPLAYCAARHWDPAMEQEWSRLRQTILDQRLHSCQTLTGLLRYSGLTRTMVWLLSIFPGMASPFVHYFNSPATARKALRV